MTTVAVLKLDLVRVPGLQKVVPYGIDAHGGIPIALTLLPLPSKGLKAVIDPYIDSAHGDVLKLFCNNIPVDSHIIEAGEENDPSSLYVAPRYLLDGLNTLHYVVTRGSQNVGESQPLRTWFHVQRPGLRDKEPSDAYHSELHIDVEDAARDGIGPDLAKRGVDFYVSYPLMRTYDKIRLSCNGYFVEHTVNASEAAAGTLTIVVNEAALKAAGDDPDCAFSYTVNDWIGNGPDLNAPYSRILFLFLKLVGGWFDKPILSEDPADGSDNPDTIELDKLKGQPVIAQIHLRALWAKGDTLALTCTFTTAEGAESSVVVNYVVERAPFFLDLPLANSNFAAAAGGSVQAVYKQLRAGKELGRSYTTRATIIGVAQPGELQPPTLVLPAKSPIDPLAELKNTLRIEYLGARAGDSARLVEVNPLPGSKPFPAQEFNKNKRTNTDLSPEFLIAHLGRPVVFRWNLIRGGQQAGQSRRLALEVLGIKDGDVRLPVPTIDGAVGNVLDVQTLVGTERLRVLRWPLQRIEQPVSVRYSGTKEDGSFTESISEGWTSTDNGYDVPAPIGWLQTLKDGEPMTVELKVNLDGVKKPTTTTNFPLRKYAIKSKKFEFEENFDTWPITIISRGQSYKRNFLTLTVLPMYVSPEAQVTNVGTAYHGKIEHNVIRLGNGRTRLRIDIDFTCNNVHFWYLNPNIKGMSAHSYDAQGRQLEWFFLEGAIANIPYQANFSVPGIQRVEIDTGGNANGSLYSNIALDNFHISRRY